MASVVVTRGDTLVDLGLLECLVYLSASYLLGAEEAMMLLALPKNCRMRERRAGVKKALAVPPPVMSCHNTKGRDMKQGSGHVHVRERRYMARGRNRRKGGGGVRLA